ncbi:GNAT family N-acetyltransferase [Mycoplasmatota bacterium WC44]
MIKVNNNSIVKSFCETNKIPTLNLVGMLKNNDNYELYVDNINEIRGILFRMRYWNILFSENEEFISNIITDFKGRNEIGFAGVMSKYFHIIKEKYEIDWEEKCYLYYLDDIKELANNNYELRKLESDHAEIVNKYYTYKDEYSLEYIKECIEKRPTSAVFVNDEPVSWVLTREDGTLGLMYTIDEYRRKGLAKIVTVDLAKKVIENGDTPFVHIAVNNKASIKLAESNGFKRYGEVYWFGIKNA